MITRFAFSVAAFASLALASTAASANSTDGWSWTRSAAQGGAYSADLPCSPEQVALQTNAYVLSRGDVLVEKRQERAADTLFCNLDGSIFRIEIIKAGASDALPSSLFDLVLGGIRSAPKRDVVVITETEHAGRRALFSQEASDSMIARTGVIELSDRSYMLLIGGAKLSSDVTAADMVSVLDRFFASVEFQNK